MLFDSRQDFRLATRGNKQRPCWPGAAGIWVGIPWLGIAVVKKHQIQLSLMSRQLEKQGRAHLPSWYLEVLITTTMHPLPGPQRALGRSQQLVWIQNWWRGVKMYHLYNNRGYTHTHIYIYIYYIYIYYIYIYIYSYIYNIQILVPKCEWAGLLNIAIVDGIYFGFVLFKTRPLKTLEK